MLCYISNRASANQQAENKVGGVTRSAASKKVLSAVDSGISRRVETDIRTGSRLHGVKGKFRSRRGAST